MKFAATSIILAVLATPLLANPLVERTGKESESNCKEIMTNPVCYRDEKNYYVACKPYCNKDIVGGDYKSLQVAKFTDCVAKCGGESKCTSAAYHESSKYCYLKDGKTSPGNTKNVDYVVCKHSISKISECKDKYEGKYS